MTFGITGEKNKILLVLGADLPGNGTSIRARPNR